MANQNVGHMAIFRAMTGRLRRRPPPTHCQKKKRAVGPFWAIFRGVGHPSRPALAADQVHQSKNIACISYLYLVSYLY